MYVMKTELNSNIKKFHDTSILRHWRAAMKVAGAWSWPDWTIWRPPVRAGETRGSTSEIQRDILDGSARMRRALHVFFLLSAISLLQNVLGRGSTANILLCDLTCHSWTSLSYWNNVTDITRNTEDGLFGCPDCRPVRLHLFHRATPPGERDSAAPRLSCHVVLLKLELPARLPTCWLPPSQRRKPQVYIKRCRSVGFGVLSGHVPQTSRLSLSSSITWHCAEAVDVCLQILLRPSPEPGSRGLVDRAYEANPQRHSARTCGVAWSKHCPRW